MSNIKYSRDDIQRILRERGVDWANSKYKSDVINGTNVAITPYTSSTFSEPSKSIGGEPKKHDFMDMGLLSNKTDTDSQGTYQKPSKEYWKNFKTIGGKVGSKGWTGMKSVGSGMVQGYKTYNEGKPKAKTGVGKIWQGVGNIVDSVVSLASVPLNLVGYTTRGLVDGTNRALEGGQYTVEHVGGTLGEVSRGLGALTHRVGRGGRRIAEGNLLEEIVKGESKHKPVIMHCPRNPYELNLIALMFLLASFISFTFSSSTTGSVIGAFSQSSMLSTFLGIIFLAASFAIFQIKRRR